MVDGSGPREARGGGGGGGGGDRTWIRNLIR